MVGTRTDRPSRPDVSHRTGSDAVGIGWWRRVLVAALTVGGLVVGTGVAVTSLRWLTSGLLAAANRGGTTLDEAVGLAAVFGCWLCAAWFVLAVVCAAVAQVPGAVGRASAVAADVLTPWTLRTMIVAGLGLTMINGPGAAAAAGGTGVPGATRALESTAEINGWAVGSRSELDLPPLDRPADARSVVVVQPGDCLWSIAAQHLGGDPADAQIAEAWPLWYDANRAVIGPDPNLLQPGQVLAVPR